MIRKVSVATLCALVLVVSLSLAQGAAPAAKPAEATKPAETAKSTSTAVKSETVKLDINSATKAELAKLPVIGDAIAEKIVAGRPYKSKHDLVTKKILTETQYTKISPSIIAKQPTAEKKEAAVEKK